MSQTTVPEGYLKDPQGRLVPKEMVKIVDLERDHLVRSIVAEAEELAKGMRDFKLKAMGDIEAFVELSAEQYQVQLGGQKGNVQLTTYDGEYQVRRAIAEHLSFDERLQAAKALIDECIHEWSEGSRPEIRTLINDAFSVDSQGKLNTNRILSLRRLDIQDDKWKRAMMAISESLQVIGSKSYLRIYKRQGDGGYKQVSLDMAAI